MKTYIDIKATYVREKIEVMNSMQAVEEWFRIQDEYGLGARDTDFVKFYEGGKHVANISYNGTITAK